MNFNRINWTLFVSSRFAHVDNKGRYATNSFLASLGIGFGVATLIIVISVMNGFQSGYIDSIMEISSFHVRAVQSKESIASKENATIGQTTAFTQTDALGENVAHDANSLIKENAALGENAAIGQTTAFTQTDVLGENAAIGQIGTLDEVLCVVPLYEAQALLVGNGSRQYPSLIRGVPENILETDKGFDSEITVVSGEFDLSKSGTIVLGYNLARSLKVSVGDKINLLAMSGSQETDLLSENRYLTVAGTFTCGYSDINSTFGFVSLDTADALIQNEKSILYGIKLKNSNHDSGFIAKAKNLMPNYNFESWRSYNRSFFGALRVEKNILMILVFLIFVVVAVNIYNSMRRLVYERREEIAVLGALGSSKNNLRFIFLTQGLLMGIKGAIPGLIMGLLICSKMKEIFSLFAKLVSFVSQFFAILLNSPYQGGISNIYLYYSSIPAKVVFSEVTLITLFGIFASVVASLLASKNIMKLSISEVLKDE